MINKEKSVLERLGFSKEESLIYLALLKQGPLSPSEIIRKTRIHRPATYRVLSKLIENRLVYIMPKGKTKVYVAESPNKIELIFQEIEDEFNAEIHELMDIHERRDKKPIVTYDEGDRAITEAISHVVHDLKKGDTYYRYSPALTLSQRKYIARDYRTVRDKKGLERFIITDESSKKKFSIKLGKTIKAVPDDCDLFSNNITQLIFGNKVLFVDYNSKSVITIENQMIAEFQKKIFKLLFKKL